MGPVNRATRINLSVGLPLQHQDELDSFLTQVADPSSPAYRQYLTPEEFARRFGPAERDYRQLIEFFTSRGFEVTDTAPNRMILDVAGTVAQVEAALHLNLAQWQHPSRGLFYAPDSEPILDTPVKILHIGGLDDYVKPRPMDLKSRPLTAIPQTTGSGPAGLFLGGDFRAAYAPGVTLTGAGQTVGLFELDGFYASDVTANFKAAGLPAVPVQTVLLDGYSGAAGSGNTEVILDIMMAAYMAPGVSKILVYEGTNWDDVLNRMATDNLARQLSSSWCFYPTDATTEQIFKQMIAQGQSLFQASGDSGAYGGWIMPPADDPNVTVVGGTSLTTNGPGGAWKSEAAWSGSGGGVSTTWPIPSYQQSTRIASAGGSASMRNIPDVAMVADIQMYLIQNNGQAIEVGGTSAAAPLWAGFMALANQQAASQQKGPIGFLNPLIYQIGNGSAYGGDMHDIASGNNGGFLALTGYDLTTGWGTPAGQGLINCLTGAANAPSFNLSLSPATLSVAAGGRGATTVTITPQNGFSGSATLAVSGLPSGVTASFSASPATTTSTLTLLVSNSAAAGTSAVTVTGTSGSITGTVRLNLTITGAPAFTISASPATLSMQQGTTATSTITMTPQNGFTGTVTLSASALPKGVTASFSAMSSSGISTLTLTAAGTAALGAAPVTITGTSGTLHPTTPINLTITAPAPNFSLSATAVTAMQGAGATSTVTIAAVNGFNSTVALSVAGLPAGVTASFNPASATTASTLTFTVSSSAPAGTSTVTVTGKSGSLTSTTTLALTVAIPQSFSLSAAPASLGLVAGANGTSTITITSSGGFSGKPTLAATGMPAGVTASFSTTSPATNSVLTLAAAKTAASGSSTITITGTSGALSAKTTVTLTIAPFTLSASPAAVSLTPGTPVSSTISIAPAGGFTGAVTVSVSSLPAGVSGTFSAGPASASVLTLTATSAAAPGLYPLTVTGKSGTVSQTTDLALTVQAPPAGSTSVNLAPIYNIPGSVSDGSKFSTGGLDGGGRAYSANLLGTAQTVNGTLYNLGPANGQGAATSITIPLPAGKFTTLKLLATGVNGNQTAQTFKVTYSDGSSSSFTQSLSDWCTPQNYTGEAKAVNMTYRDNSDGTRDTRTLELYGYSFNLSGAKTVSALTLPNNRNVVVLAVNLSTMVQVNLSGVFDTTGIVSDGHAFTGGIDGVGYAYSGNLLGTAVTFNQTVFNLGPANSADVVSGSGKSIGLPAGQFSSLQILGTGVNGSQQAQTIKVAYSDGTTSTFTQSFSDWFTPLSFTGESVAVNAAYRDTASGAIDNRPFHLYGYSFVLNNVKTVSGIVLPANPNLKLLAVTLAP